MAWIKLDHSTGNKPEVFIISQRLEINRAETLGHLVALWVWFDQVSEDGTIKGNKAMVDSLTLPGFADTLIELNWLKEIGDKLELPNFCNHNGQTAKQRCQAQSRQAKFRNNANGVTKTPLEKRREEKKRINYQHILDLWNNTNEPKAQRMTDKRRAAIRNLLAEFTEEQLKEVFSQVQKIPFLRGENDRGWRADIDYILRPDKFLKILEGGWNTNKEQPTKTEYNKWHE